MSPFTSGEIMFTRYRSNTYRG